MGSADTSEIVNVLNLYALAIDTQRWELFDLVFSSDVDSDYPSDMHWRDLESFKRDFAALHDPLYASQHTITNHQVVVDADRATSIAYGHWRLIRRLPQGGWDVWEGSGWYDDGLVRSAVGWRINSRVCRVIWSSGDAVIGDKETAAEHSRRSLRQEAGDGKLAYLAALKAARLNPNNDGKAEGPSRRP